MQQQTIFTNKEISLNAPRNKKRFLFHSTWIILLLMTATMWQCRKDDFKGEVKGVCPRVLTTDPANNDTNVFVNKNLTVVFNELMDSMSINSSTFLLTQGTNQIAGTVSYSGNSAVFNPASYLAVNTTYTATITSKAKDRAGITLSANFTWSFTTGKTVGVDGPVIIFTDPYNGATSVPLNRKITAVFNKPMNPLNINSTTFMLKQGTTVINGTINYVGTSATFIPAINLAVNTMYTATVTTGVTDLGGNPLLNDYTWTFTTGGVSDLSAPTVIETDPGSGANNVALNKIIKATFSKSLDPASVNPNTYMLKQGSLIIPGVISSSGANAVFMPSSNLIQNTVYTVTLTTGVKDLAGNALASSYVWSFTTGGAIDNVPPTVVSTDPLNAATNVPVNKIIKANFSKSMNPLSINGNTYTLKQGSVTIQGSVSYSGITASFAPSVNLLAGTVYNVTVTNGVKDLAGNAMVNNYNWSFTTAASADLTPPTVTSTDPGNMGTNVALNKIIKANFSKSLNPATVNSTTFLLKTGATNVTGTINYSGLTASFTPSSDLLSSTTYTATVTTGVKDLAGNAMANNYSWTFSTGLASDTVRPKVISTDPSNLASSVALDKIIKASFSESMDASTISSATFVVKQGSASISGIVSYSGTTAVFTPSANLMSGNTYTATITNGAKDLAGNALASNYVWTFSTISPAGPGSVDLSSAGNFAILAGAGVTNSGPTIINGDLGTSPTGTVTGFPPGKVNGNIQAANPTAAQAKKDLTSAYNDAQGRSSNAISLPGDMKGLTFYPGLYVNSTTVMLSSGNVTLDAKGDANAVFIFKMGSTLTTFGSTKVILTGGAQAKNIFWAVGTSATLGSYSTFYGNILADQSISLNTGVIMGGRALTRIASVTLLSDTVTKP
jgi:hypothetical protein